MKNILARVAKHSTSPIFLAMFFTSFVFWYIAKLGYNYTTDIKVEVHVGESVFDVPCVVEGLGTTLIGYHISRGVAIKISPDALKFANVEPALADGYYSIDPQSLKDNIAIRFSDIKVVSVGESPIIKIE